MKIFIVLSVILVLLWLNLNKSQVIVEEIKLPSPTPVQRSIDADKLFQLVNDWRIENGYQPYKKSDFICNVASVRLGDTLTTFSHDGFSADRFCKECTLGENLAKGFSSEQAILGAWLKSPIHHKELTLPYTYSCIKTSKDYVVENFSYF